MISVPIDAGHYQRPGPMASPSASITEASRKLPLSLT